MIILCHTDHSSLFLLYITLVFYNIRRVSYWMAMMTSVLTLSLHLSYWMARDDSMCLRCHSTFGGYYYFPYLRPYFVSVVTATFVLTLYLPISDIMVSCVLSQINISAYNFSIIVSLSFFFILDLTLSIFPICGSFKV